MDEVIQTFKSFDVNGDGLISYSELAVLLQTVDPTIDDEKFKVLMEDTGMGEHDKVKFEEFAAWLNGDKEVPSVIKGDAPAGDKPAKEEAPKKEEEAKSAAAEDPVAEAAKGEGDDEDSEGDVSDGEPFDEREVDDSLKNIDLDLDAKVSKQEWVMIMSKLSVDAHEAIELWDDIVEELKEEGLGSEEAGYPLREFLEELRVEVQDLETMKAIAKAAAEAKKMIADGQEIKAEGEVSDTQMKLAIDKIVRALDYEERPAEDCIDIIYEGKVPLSKIQKQGIWPYVEKKAEMVQMVKDIMASPPLVNSSAGANANREICVSMVDDIIKKFKEDGTKYTDPDFDLTKNPEACLYVDKEKPGYDCTVAKPHAYKRYSELFENAVVFKGGIRAGDIIQGQIGTCFLLGALGAVVSNSDNALRKTFLKYDVKAGVFGIRFYMNGEWTHVLIDDYMPVDQYDRIVFAHSKDPEEMWVSLIEKAFCKLHTCYEMCDGGFSNEAIFNLFGGQAGSIKPDKWAACKKDPGMMFKTFQYMKSRGFLLTVHFSPKTGKQEGGGKCGEATFDSGLVGGHCYSILKSVEAQGHKLVCCRNPWGQGEWTGKWSDKNAHGEWTDEMKQATGYTGLNDGKFWMSMEDFMENAGGVEFARPFGPNWKKITQYKRFQKSAMLATPKWSYGARAGDELDLTAGTPVKVEALSAGWWYGSSTADESKKGYFPGNYVRLNDRPVARFDLDATKLADADGPVEAIVLLMQPDASLKRKFYKRKEDGLNYKDTKYPCIRLVTVGPDGHMEKKQGWKRSVFSKLTIPDGGKVKIYAYCVDGVGNRFTLRIYLKEASGTLVEVPATIQELKDIVAK